MGRPKIHDWDAILKDLQDGFSKNSIYRKHKISKSVLTTKLSTDYKHLALCKPQNAIREKQVKIKPLKALNMQCPIVQKIEIIKLLNKKIPHHQIATQLKIDILEVKKIIHKAKSGEK